MEIATNRLLELQTQHEHEVFQKQFAIQEHELATRVSRQSKQPLFIERVIAHAKNVLVVLVDVQIGVKLLEE